MLLHGREVKFLRTVWAINEVAKNCPNQNIGKFSETLKNESTIAVNDTWANFMIALNTGYEMARKYEDKDYVSNPLTVDELYTLSEGDFAILINEAIAAWVGDVQTVEVEESKKNEKTEETSD